MASLLSYASRTAVCAAVVVCLSACSAPTDEGEGLPTPGNRWPSASPPAGLTGGGWEIGDTVPDLTLADQFGDPVDLRQFWGRNLVLSFSAMWCAPCRQLAAEIEPLTAESEVLALTVLLQDASGLPVSSEEASEWADELALAGPTLADPEGRATSALHGIFPRVLLIDRALTVRADCDPPTTEALAVELQALLDSESES